MKKLVICSNIKGKIKVPSSKSFMQRATAAALLADGDSFLVNPSFCDDSKVALSTIKVLGAEVEIKETFVKIRGGLKQKAHILDCGEAGLSVRMFTPIASLLRTGMTFIGTGSLRKRPVSMLEAPLKALGAECNTCNGFLPITVKGPLTGGKAKVDGSISSQFLTGLLFALPKAETDSELIVHNLRSKPYIDMTLNLLDRFGIRVVNEDYKRFLIKGGQDYLPGKIRIEGDWSGAAFLAVAGAIAGEVELMSLSTDTYQGDVQILEVLKRVGAIVKEKDNSIVIRKRTLDAFEFDATECPDLFPPLVALASLCDGTSRIIGVKRLKFKESARDEVLKQEFSKIGAKIEIIDNTMVVYSGSISGGEIDSHNDHRIAMAAAVAGLCASKPIIINNAECVSKSYENFFKDLDSIRINRDEMKEELR